MGPTPTKSPPTGPRALLRALLVPAVVLAATLAAPRAGAQDTDGIRIGLHAGAYLPTDADVRRAFGDVLPVLGVALAPPARPGATRIYPSIELVGARSGHDRFFVIPLTAVLEHQWRGSAGGAAVPYARADAGIGYFDYRVTRDPGTRVRRARRGGAVGGAEVGMIFTRYLRAGVRYRLFQEMDGLGFGGVEVGVVVGAVKIF